MKTIFALFFTMVISFAAFGWGSTRPKPVEVVLIPSEPQIFVPKVDPGHIFTQAHITATVSHAVRITRLVEAVEAIINSEKFKKRVLGAWYQGKAQFVDTSLSNAEVYEKIRHGAEGGSASDWTWNLKIGIERALCSTLGWTYPGTTQFWINSCGLDKRSDSGLAGTICHEYTHKLGFKHDKSRTVRRQFSVPYIVGTVCAELYREMF